VPFLSRQGCCRWCELILENKKGSFQERKRNDFAQSSAEKKSSA